MRLRRVTQRSRGAGRVAAKRRIETKLTAHRDGLGLDTAIPKRRDGYSTGGWFSLVAANDRLKMPDRKTPRP